MVTKGAEAAPYAVADKDVQRMELDGRLAPFDLSDVWAGLVDPFGNFHPALGFGFPFRSSEVLSHNYGVSSIERIGAGMTAIWNRDPFKSRFERTGIASIRLSGPKYPGTQRFDRALETEHFH